MPKYLDEKDVRDLHAQGIIPMVKLVEAPKEQTQEQRQTALLREITTQLAGISEALGKDKKEMAPVIAGLQRLEDSVKTMCTMMAKPKAADNREWKVEAKRQEDGTMTARIWKE